MNWWNEKVYFFRGSEYSRYDIAADRVEDGYPKPISGHWPGVWAEDIDAAVHWGDGKVYFFKKSEYTRYDMATDRADLGPVPIPAAFDDLSANGGSPRAIAWGTRVTDAFRNRILEIAANLEAEPSYLMAAIAFETGRTFSPSVRNKASGATGLIQFMPSTATSLGTSTDELATMSAEAQLDFVARYFQPNRGKLRTAGRRLHGDPLAGRSREARRLRAVLEAKRPVPTECGPRSQPGWQGHENRCRTAGTAALLAEGITLAR